MPEPKLASSKNAAVPARPSGSNLLGKEHIELRHRKARKDHGLSFCRPRGSTEMPLHMYKWNVRTTTALLSQMPAQVVQFRY